MGRGVGGGVREAELVVEGEGDPAALAGEELGRKRAVGDAGRGQRAGLEEGGEQRQFAGIALFADGVLESLQEGFSDVVERRLEARLVRNESEQQRDLGRQREGRCRIGWTCQ